MQLVWMDVQRIGLSIAPINCAQIYFMYILIHYVMILPEGLVSCFDNFIESYYYSHNDRTLTLYALITDLPESVRITYCMYSFW